MSDSSSNAKTADSANDVKKMPYQEAVSGRRFDDLPEVPKDNYTKRASYAFIGFLNNVVDQIKDKLDTWSGTERPPYYHRTYRRVPTLDECYTDDTACIYEAEKQYRRDKSVDAYIVLLLRQRFQECVHYNTMEFAERCSEIKADSDQAQTNYLIKYGDMFSPNVIDVYMKQKYRMIHERRMEERRKLKEQGKYKPKLLSE